MATLRHVVVALGIAVALIPAPPAAARSDFTGRRVVPASVTPQVAYANDLPMERGALIIRIDADGPAESAGLKGGDVITGVAGRPATDLHHFHDLLSTHKIGETVGLSIWRDGQPLAIRVTLNELR